MSSYRIVAGFLFLIAGVVAWSNPALAAYDMAAACFFLLWEQGRSKP